MQVKLLDLQEQYRPLREEIRATIDECCDNQDFILGPRVERFEKNLAAYCGVKHAIGVSSGTDALLCSLMALGITAGDEVICPPFTFFATAGCIARTGARPVFVDIDPQTFNLDPARIERAITPRTRAIMPVHLYGQCADMDAINVIAAKHNLKVIEDAAQAIGAKYHNKRACALSFAGCLSFYPTKNLGAFGDAGAICTNDDAFADKCRKGRVHGSGHTYYHEWIGGMFRLSALQASVLDIKLRHLESWHEGRRRNAAIYDAAFAGSKVKAPYIAPGSWSVYNQYCVLLENRDQVKAKLAEKGIGSAIYYPLPLHQQPCFAYLGGKQGDYPVSERIARQILAIPVYAELKQEQVQYVAQQLLAATEALPGNRRLTV
jgi:dTDP-4-amino-4,6-dideoxygalactose transaminase